MKRQTFIVTLDLKNGEYVSPETLGHLIEKEFTDAGVKVDLSGTEELPLLPTSTDYNDDGDRGAKLWNPGFDRV